MAEERRSRPCLPADAPDAPPDGWGVAELHAHTTASDGVRAPQTLVTIAETLGLDVLAITDHDTMEGAFRAQEFATGTGARVEVVLGMEVTTRRQDHVVGLFLREPLPIFRTVPDTVEAIHAQGGLAIVAHPFLGLPSSISPKRLQAALRQVRFDGIEVENPYMRERVRERVRAFRDEHARQVGAPIGDSDAHFGDLGRAVTLFAGRTAHNLRRAIEQGTTVAIRGSLRHPRPRLQDHAQNQYRSLLKLPLMRLRILSRQLWARQA